MDLAWEAGSSLPLDNTKEKSQFVGSKASSIRHCMKTIGLCWASPAATRVLQLDIRALNDECTAEEMNFFILF